MHDVAQLHVQPHIPTSNSSLLNTSKMNSMYIYCVVAMLFYVLQISLPEQKLQTVWGTAHFRTPHSMILVKFTSQTFAQQSCWYIRSGL